MPKGIGYPGKDAEEKDARKSFALILKMKNMKPMKMDKKMKKRIEEMGKHK